MENPNGISSNVFEKKLKYFEGDHSNSFKIQFEFQSAESYSQFMNLFQTHNEGRGIRVEQQNISDTESILFLQYRDTNNAERFFRIEKIFNPREKNKLYLEKNINNRLKVFLNDALIFNGQIGKQEIVFDEFAVGTGLSKSRNYFGTIQNISYEYDVYKKQSRIPIILLLATFTFPIIYRFRERITQRNIRRILNLNQISLIFIISFLNIFIQSRKDFADFFGDDFITLWPARNSNLWNVISEITGGTYRPITEIWHIIRFQLHEYNLISWMIGNYLLSTLVCLYFYYILLKIIQVKRTVAFLITLIFLTSPIFFSSAFWWVANGSQHGLSLLLTLSFIHYIWNNVENNRDVSVPRNLTYFSIILTLTTDALSPVLLATPLYLLYLTFGNERKKIRHKNIYKAKNKYPHNKKNQRVKINSLAHWFFCVLMLFYFRNVLAKLDIATAATSAANYKYTSVDFMNSIIQYAKYLFSFFNLYFGEFFYDIGAGYGQIKSSKLTISFQSVFILLSIILIVVLIYFKIKNLLNMNILSKLMLSIFLISLAPFAMVPNYMQLRWVQLSYILFLIFLAKLNFTKSKLNSLKFALLFILIYTNCQSLMVNFGISFNFVSYVLGFLT